MWTRYFNLASWTLCGTSWGKNWIETHSLMAASIFVLSFLMILMSLGCICYTAKERRANEMKLFYINFPNAKTYTTNDLIDISKYMFGEYVFMATTELGYRGIYKPYRKTA